MNLLPVRMSNYADVDLQKAGWMGSFATVISTKCCFMDDIKLDQNYSDGEKQISYRSDERTSTSGISRWFERMWTCTHTRTHATANHAMQQPQQPVELPIFDFLFCWKTHHSMPTLPTGKLVISLWESVESDLCSVLCHNGNFPHQKHQETMKSYQETWFPI